MNVSTVVRRNRIAFLLACCAAAVTVFMNEGWYRQSVNTLDHLGSVERTHSELLALQLGFFEAESAQRGYLSSHRQVYLQPYGKALRKIEVAPVSRTP